MIRRALRSRGGGPAILAGCMLVATAPGAATGAEPSPTPQQEAQAFLQRAREVRGTADLWSRLLSIHRSGTLLYPSPQGDRQLTLALTVEPPGRVRLETSDGHVEEVRLLEPGGAWEVQGANRSPLSVAAREGLERLARTDEAFLIRHALSGVLVPLGVEAAGRGELPDDYPSVMAVAVRLRDRDGSILRLVVPEAGGLPLRLDYRATGADGAMTPVSEAYRDWRPVEGILFPFEVALFREGRATALVRYGRMEVRLSSPPAASP